MKSAVEFYLDCPQCQKRYKGKAIVGGYVKYCSNCGYKFSRNAYENEIKKVRELRQIEKDFQREFKKQLEDLIKGGENNEHKSR